MLKSPLTIPSTMQVYHPPVFTDPDRLAKIRAFFPEIKKNYHAQAEKNHFPGYAFGIMVDGQLAYVGSGGFSDIAKKTPATPQSMFRIASMTKSLTAMAILKLRDAGKLKLDDPVSLYIPEMHTQQFIKDASAITIRDLMIHAAGLPTDDPWADRKLNETEEELIALLESGINFSNVPGITYEYSNLGYAMLGCIIKKITGIPYGKFVKEEICQPLGMKDVAWDFNDVSAAQLVHGYRWGEEQWEEEALLSDGVFGAMGGMITSIEAFSRYVAMHQQAWPPRDEAEQDPLKRSSIREMQQPWKFNELVRDFNYSDTSGSSIAMTKGYGYGLSWSKDSQGRIFVGHCGGLPGFGSNWTILPEYGIGAILFASVTYAPAGKINLEVLDQLIKAAQLMPRQLPASTLLKKKQKALLEFLQHWENALASEIFAKNFFQDNPLELLQNTATKLFDKAGKIKFIEDVIPENQLRGHFIMEGENCNLQINFGLSPENPPLIQQFQMSLSPKKPNCEIK